MMKIIVTQRRTHRLQGPIEVQRSGSKAEASKSLSCQLQAKHKGDLPLKPRFIR